MLSFFRLLRGDVKSLALIGVVGDTINKKPGLSSGLDKWSLSALQFYTVTIVSKIDATTCVKLSEITAQTVESVIVTSALSQSACVCVKS